MSNGDRRFRVEQDFFGVGDFFPERVSLDDTGSIQDDRIGGFLSRRKKEGEFVMSNKNITNRILTVVSSVSSNWGKSELETCNRKNGGAR